MSMVIIKQADITKDELVEANKIQEKPAKNKYHSYEAHNYHIKRHNRCLYCMLGSTPVHKAELAELTK